jgi:hypothetical protein
VAQGVGPEVKPQYCKYTYIYVHIYMYFHILNYFTYILYVYINLRKGNNHIFIWEDRMIQGKIV